MSKTAFKWKIFRVSSANYCDELADVEMAYSTEALERIRSDGFNAVWLRIVLRETVSTSVFPELQPSPEKLENLRKIVRRCAEFHLRVFLYLNEPLGYPSNDPFWDSHPHLKGQLDQSFDDGWDQANALCTSVKETQIFLEESSYNIFYSVPELAGVILITASEHLTHCYSHESKYLGKRSQYAPEVAYPLTCEKCAERTVQEVVGEVVRCITQGIRRANSSAEVIAWNWSWSFFERDPQEGFLSSLPKEVAVMADFERGGLAHLNLSAKVKKLEIDEYSLGYCGPSPRFQNVATAVEQNALELYAKLQIGTTHEISTVPNIPLIPHIFRKLKYLQQNNASGFLACWCFGTFPSLNTFATGWLADKELEDEDEALSVIAREYFPGSDADQVVRAWHRFCDAFSYFPFNQKFLYRGPINAAPAYLWAFDGEELPMRPSWFQAEPYGTRLEDCLIGLSLEEIIEAFGYLLPLWQEGVDMLEKSLAHSQCSHATQEIGVAQMIGHQIHNANNLFRFYLANQLHDIKKCREIIREELSHLKASLPLVQKDSRLGFHQGCFPLPQYFYNEKLILRKIASLEVLLRSKI